MSNVYLYEFLYRGRPPGSTEAPAYHVILAEEVSTLGVVQHCESRALTPDQAAAQGFGLPAIHAAINAGTMTALDAAKAEAVALASERDALSAERDTLTAQLGEARAALAALQPAAPAPETADI